ncbi:hypothetical protein K32_29420 [Kaistia sp. 32K]|nr:hypothetical protein K32_29420 [Kaistia sp. 32K]
MNTSSFSIRGIQSEQLTNSAAIRLPLVSFVILRSGETDFGLVIEAIRAQDYPDIEAVLVDDGATEASSREIQGLIAGDPRFKLVSSEQQLGPMAAARQGYDRTVGAFVVFLDTAVLPLPQFASSHVQAHLASRHVIAFTASRILAGAIPEPAAPKAPATGLGLLREDTAIRLSCLGEADFEALAAKTVLLDPVTAGWTTSPGMLAVYRRHVVEQLHPVDDPAAPDDLSVNTHYAGLAHLLGGSAAIDMPLAQAIGSTDPSRASKARASASQTQQMLGVWARNGSDLERRIGLRRYWDALCVLMAPASERADAASETAFKGILPLLTATFGEKQTIHRLNQRLPKGQFRAMLHAHHGPNLPFRTHMAVRLSTLRSWHNRLRLALRKHRRRLRGHVS